MKLCCDHDGVVFQRRAERRRSDGRGVDGARAKRAGGCARARTPATATAAAAAADHSQ